MNIESSDTFDTIVEQALALHEKGKSIPDIIAAFPEHENAVRDLFHITAELEILRDIVTPPEDVLRSIVARTDAVVTHLPSDRYLFTGGVQGRSSLQQFISNYHYFFMKKGIVGLVAVLLLVILGGAYYWQGQRGVAVTDAERQLAAEEAELDRDIADMESFNQDSFLDDLDGALAMISENDGGVVPPGDTAVGESISVDVLDADLASALDSFSGDMSDLEGFTDDTSLDNLDSGLSSV